MTEGARDFGGSRRDLPPHGSLAEEAAKLADVAQLWLKARSAGAAWGAAGAGAGAGARENEPWGAATDDATSTSTSSTSASAAHDGTAPECRTCPICRARRFANNLDPEVLGHLSDAVASMSAAVAAFGRNRRSGTP
jgi:hypothetical protein